MLSCSAMVRYEDIINSRSHSLNRVLCIRNDTRRRNRLKATLRDAQVDDNAFEDAVEYFERKRYNLLEDSIEELESLRTREDDFRERIAKLEKDVKRIIGPLNQALRISAHRQSQSSKTGRS